jgi:hypothetical protein
VVIHQAGRQSTLCKRSSCFDHLYFLSGHNFVLAVDL